MEVDHMTDFDGILRSDLFHDVNSTEVIGTRGLRPALLLVVMKCNVPDKCHGQFSYNPRQVWPRNKIGRYIENIFRPCRFKDKIPQM